MKKILILAIILLTAITTYGLDGDGSSGNPYSGTISSAIIWDPSDYANGEIYVGTESNNDLTIGNSGHLTILAGATIIFTQPTSDLIITGTGQITADASAGNEITFTRASENANWGHIVFESTGTSIIDYCIIEYGDVSSLSAPASYGGGIFIKSSSLTVSNSTIRKNKASHGGGILVDENINPSISNCVIKNNTSNKGGGGLLFRTNASTNVTNCIIESNTANVNSNGGGGIWFTSSGGVYLYNCIIVNNSAPNSTNGDNIAFYNNNNSTSPQFTNCIIWGSSNSILYIGSSVQNSTDFIYSALEGSYGSSYENCIDLNSINDHPEGPNFNATNGSDWSIAFLSPCRDEGTNSGGVPSNDYDGNNRIGPTDIGSYEVQYSRWLGSSGDWSSSSNWLYNMTPGEGSNVVIPGGASNYPSTNTEFNLASLFIESGGVMTINASDQSYVTDSLYNNAGTTGLVIKSDDSNIGSLIHNSPNVDATSELYVTGGGTSPDFNWHYISSPMSNLSTSAFTSTTDNLVGYFEERPTDNDYQGWVAYDGYVYDDGSTDNNYIFGTLAVGEGYNLYHSSTSHTFSLTGQLNTGDISIDLDYTTTNTGEWNGLNLAGNPYPSSIDWALIADGLDANISHAIYFTRASDNNIVSWADGVASHTGVSSVIPPMQGFFIKTYASGTSINLDASTDRLHGTQPRYKSGSTIPLVRLKFTDQNESDETVIRLDNSATSGLDNVYDASKFLLRESRNLVWTELNNEKYSINAIAFPDDEITIPLVLNVPVQGDYTLNSLEIIGLDSYNVKLTDKAQSNFEIDLKETSEYTFTAEKGIIDNRFTITIGGYATSIFDNESPETSFKVYTSNNQLNISTQTDKWNKASEVRIYSITGSLIKIIPDVYLYKGETIHLPFNQPQGIYLIEITDGVKKEVNKISKLR